MNHVKEFSKFLPSVIILVGYLFLGSTALWIAVLLTSMITGGMVLYRMSGKNRLANLFITAALVMVISVGSIATLATALIFGPGLIARIENVGKPKPPAMLLWSVPLFPPLLAEFFQGTVIGGPGFNARLSAFTLNVVQSTGNYAVCTLSTGSGNMTVWGLSAIPTVTVSTANNPTIAIQDNNATVNTWLAATATTNMTAGRALPMTSPALRQTTLNGNGIRFVVGTATITTGSIDLTVAFSITNAAGSATANCT